MLLSAFYLFLSYSFTMQSCSADLVSEHSFFAPLDEGQNVKLFWNVSTANKEIFFTVEAKTTGWIGFGISSGQGKMEGADIVIGWVKDGNAYFKVIAYFTIPGGECFLVSAVLISAAPDFWICLDFWHFGLKSVKFCLLA